MNSKRSNHRVTTSSVTPPAIVAYFHEKLLGYPIPGIQKPEYYRERYGNQIKSKYKQGSRKMREYEELIKVCEEIYEWKKAKKAYQEAETKKILERPVAPIKAINRIRGRLGKVIREFFTYA